MRRLKQFLRNFDQYPWIYARLSIAYVHIRRFTDLLRPDQWAWLHAKLSLTTWALLLLAFTPPPVSAVLGFLIAGSISVLTVGGVGISAWGLFTSKSQSFKKVKKGVELEISGLWIAITGPAAYAVTQFFLMVDEGTTLRVPQIAVFYSLCAFLLVRLVLAYGYRRKLTA